LLGRLLVGWWGGPRWARTERVEGHAQSADPASYARAFVYWLALATAGGLAWLPVLGVVFAALGPEGPASSVGAFPGIAVAEVAGDTLIRGYLIHAAALGVMVLLVDLVFARALAAWAEVGWAGRAIDKLAGWLEAVPPLAVGVGALSLPEGLRMAADALKTDGPWRRISALATSLADLIDPDRTPWFALVLAVAVVRLPLSARSALARRRTSRPVLFDAALLLGASRRRARGTLPGRWLGASTSAAILTLALAATNLTPALLLAPTAETRPDAPALILLTEEPGDGRARAAALASMAIAVNLAALGLASTRRRTLFRDWLGR
jgi:iron(III) transport system permease protein